MFARCVQWSLRPEGGIRCSRGGVKGRCVCPEVVVQSSTQVLLQEQWALLTAELSLQSHKTCLWKLYDIRNLSEHAETEDQWHCRSLRYLPVGLSSSRSPHWGGAVHWDVSVRQSFRTSWDVLTREKTLLTPKKIEKNRGWVFILPQAQPKKLHFVVLWKADLEQSVCSRYSAPLAHLSPFRCPSQKIICWRNDPENWRKRIQSLHGLLFLFWGQNPWQKQLKGGIFTAVHSLEGLVLPSGKGIGTGVVRAVRDWGVDCPHLISSCSKGNSGWKWD